MTLGVERGGVTRTVLAECPACHVLVHQPVGEPYVCPQCFGALGKGLVHVGFDDARRIYGEPGAPWRPPPEPELVEKMTAVWKCSDGHKARSREEWLVDEWLHREGIPHEREPKLKGMRPDWRVGNVYVEYWGLMGAQGYEARREEKLDLYRRRRLRLVELFPDDLENLEAKLGWLRDDPAAQRQRLGA